MLALGCLNVCHMHAQPPARFAAQRHPEKSRSRDHYTVFSTLPNDLDQSIIRAILWNFGAYNSSHRARWDSPDFEDQKCFCLSYAAPCYWTPVRHVVVSWWWHPSIFIICPVHFFGQYVTPAHALESGSSTSSLPSTPSVRLADSRYHRDLLLMNRFLFIFSTGSHIWLYHRWLRSRRISCCGSSFRSG